MTEAQAERYASVRSVLMDRHGISSDDVESLLRIERTLGRWGERECNGEVEVEEDGKAFALREWGAQWTSGKRCRTPTANREAGALKRLAAIMARYPKLAAYHQGDPRGCALYVYRHDDLDRFAANVQEKSVAIATCYSSIGVAVCWR